MLIFSRNIGEDFYIGENVRVVILACDRSGRARIGIEGPREVVILRGELIRPLPRPKITPALTDEKTYCSGRTRSAPNADLTFPPGQQALEKQRKKGENR